MLNIIRTTQIKTLESERDLLQGRMTVLISETESDARTASEDRQKTEAMERELNQTKRELHAEKQASEVSRVKLSRLQAEVDRLKHALEKLTHSLREEEERRKNQKIDIEKERREMASALTSDTWSLALVTISPALIT